MHPTTDPVTVGLEPGDEEVVPQVERRAPGLSPSRASDFLQCPLLFRFRTVDRLPEPPSEAAARGTLVHAVLERLYDAPRGQRTLGAARALLPQEWARLVASEPELAELVPDGDTAAWLSPAEELLATYFTLEDPNRLEPAGRELYLEVELEDGPALRGLVDRLDVAPDGAIRVVDYKTGRTPRPEYESGVLFQMRFYALVLLLTRGVVPRLLQVMYLSDGQVLRHTPDEAELRATERKVRALWTTIQQVARTGSWQARRSSLCGWCAHQEICPAFGGTPPPVPEGAVELALGVVPEHHVAPGDAAAGQAVPRRSST